MSNGIELREAREMSRVIVFTTSTNLIVESKLLRCSPQFSLWPGDWPGGAAGGPLFTVQLSREPRKMADLLSEKNGEIPAEISPEEVIGRYKGMRNEIKKMTLKIDELETEFNEHQ